MYFTSNPVIFSWIISFYLLLTVPCLMSLSLHSSHNQSLFPAFSSLSLTLSLMALYLIASSSRSALLWASRSSSLPSSTCSTRFSSWTDITENMAPGAGVGRESVRQPIVLMKSTVLCSIFRTQKYHRCIQSRVIRWLATHSSR